MLLIRRTHWGLDLKLLSAFGCYYVIKTNLTVEKIPGMVFNLDYLTNFCCPGKRGKCGTSRKLDQLTR
jgi:hypothetical protein